MSRTEEGGDLPIRRIPNNDYHVDGELVLASKERLLMYFRNCLPFLRLLQNMKVLFLSLLPRYLYRGCCDSEDHGTNRGDEDFEDNLKTGLQEIGDFFKDFLFTNGLRGFRIRNPGHVVSGFDESGDPLWQDDPVHPTYEGYNRIADLIEQEAASMLGGGNKRKGDRLAHHSKRPRFEFSRPAWINMDQGRGGGRGGDQGGHRGRYAGGRGRGGGRWMPRGCGGGHY